MGRPENHAKGVIRTAVGVFHSYPPADGGVGAQPLKRSSFCTDAALWMNRRVETANQLEAESSAEAYGTVESASWRARH